MKIDSVFSQYIDTNPEFVRQTDELIELEKQFIGNILALLKEQGRKALLIATRSQSIKDFNFLPYFYTSIQNAISNLWQSSIELGIKHGNSEMGNSGLATFASYTNPELQKVIDKIQVRGEQERERDKRIEVIQAQALMESQFGEVYLEERSREISRKLSTEESKRVKQNIADYISKTKGDRASGERLARDLYKSIYESDEEDKARKKQASSLLTQFPEKAETIELKEQLRERKLNALENQLAAAYRRKASQKEIDRIINRIDAYQEQESDLSSLRQQYPDKSSTRVIKLTASEKQALGVQQDYINKSDLTKLREPSRTSQVANNRIYKVATTELNAGYNLGRLDTYSRNGVEYVRWKASREHQRLNKVCKNLCFPRSVGGYQLSGIYKLNDALNNRELVMPQHPYCLCYWEPVKDFDPKKKAYRFDFAKNPNNSARNWAIASGSVLGLASLYFAYTQLVQPSVAAKTIRTIAPSIVTTAPTTVPTETIARAVQRITPERIAIPNDLEILSEIPQSLTLQEIQDLRPQVNLPLLQPIDLSPPPQRPLTLLPSPLIVQSQSDDRALDFAEEVENFLNASAINIARYTEQQNQLNDIIARIDRLTYEDIDAVLIEITLLSDDARQIRSRYLQEATELRKQGADALDPNLEFLERAIAINQSEPGIRLQNGDRAFEEIQQNLQQSYNTLQARQSQIVESTKLPTQARLTQLLAEIQLADFTPITATISAQSQEIENLLNSKNTIRFDDYRRIKTTLLEIEEELNQFNFLLSNKNQIDILVRDRSVSLLPRRRSAQLIKNNTDELIAIKKRVDRLRGRLKQVYENTPTYKAKTGISKWEQYRQYNITQNNIDRLIATEIETLPPSQQASILRSIQEATGIRLTWAELLNNSQKDRILTSTNNYLQQQADELFRAEFKRYVPNRRYCYIRRQK